MESLRGWGTGKKKKKEGIKKKEGEEKRRNVGRAVKSRKD